MHEVGVCRRVSPSQIDCVCYVWCVYAMQLAGPTRCIMLDGVCAQMDQAAKRRLASLGGTANVAPPVLAKLLEDLGNDIPE